MQKKVTTVFRDRTQKQRQEALNELEKGDCDILVSTNVTSRGLNIFGIGLVVNYEVKKNNFIIGINN
jgi:superfamily II DNA/RNA helicase